MGNDAVQIDGKNYEFIGDLELKKVASFQAIQNGEDGISADAKLHILHNRFTGNSDAIDYEGGGGICSNNVFEYNSDDAVDLDRSTEAIVENNIIRYNGDDGIEGWHEHGQYELFDFPCFTHNVHIHNTQSKAHIITLCSNALFNSWSV